MHYLNVNLFSDLLSASVLFVQPYNWGHIFSGENESQAENA